MSKLKPTERAKVRKFLKDHFDISEARNLAFDLGVNYQVLSHETIEELSRELIAYCERRDQLHCMLTEVLRQRRDDDLMQLLAQLPPCAPRKKILIFVAEDLLEDLAELVGKFATSIGVPEDEVVLVGAAWGSIRLLICLPEKAADLRVLSEIRTLGNDKYHIALIDTFDSLDSASQEAWRWVACNWPPIRQGSILRPAASWKDALEVTRMERWVFVAREDELFQLDGFLKRALAGQGQVCFVCGEAGIGKTALVTEFARRAQERYEDLIVAIGQSDALTGVGDPYLPFREVLGLLTGDVETKLAQGIITQENASRLRKFLHLSGQALVEVGPDLVGTLVPAAGLVARVGAFVVKEAEWVKKLERWMGQSRERRAPGSGDIEQDHIFEQYTSVLRELAKQKPLMLVLDDLHWADAASIGLLFRLGRRIGKNRILIVGTYRPDEVALGRAGKRHPLDRVLTQLKRYFGNVWVDLDKAEKSERQRFVDDFLDTELNRFSREFRQALYDHTVGNPLFTIELLRHMQGRGDIVRDEQGRWIEGPVLNWRGLPPRVEGVIEERIGRLEQCLRDILDVATVEGERFTAQVIAEVQEVREREMLHALSQELEKRHRLVREEGEVCIDQCFLSRYRFTHALVQHYLYNALEAGRRRLLHKDVGNVLEELYGDQVDEIAMQLARHFVEAGNVKKAIYYLHRAGEQAAARFANAEAVSYFKDALSRTTADTLAERRVLHLELGKVLARSGEFEEAIEHLTEAYQLFEHVSEPAAALLQARTGCEIGRIYMKKGGKENLGTALEWQAEGLALLRETPKPEAVSLHLLGANVGVRQLNLERIDHECERALKLAQETGAKTELGLIYRTLAFSARARGRLDLASEYCQKSIKVCEELSDLMGLANSYANIGVLAFEVGDWQLAETSYLRALKTQERVGDRLQIAITSCNLGDLYYHRGEDLEEGFAYARRALSIFIELEAAHRITAQVVLATLYLRQGELGRARRQLSEARELVATLGAAPLGPTVGRWSVEVHLAEGNLAQAGEEIQPLLTLDRDALGIEFEPVQRLWGRILAAQGEPGEAVRILQESLARLEETPARYEFGCTLLAQADVLAQIGGSATEAMAYAERAGAIFYRLGAKLDLEEADRLISRLLVIQGRQIEAVDMLEGCVERLEQGQIPYQVARTRLALARVLAQVEGRAVEARTHAERARAVFADLSAKFDLEAADILIAELSRGGSVDRV